MKLFAVLVASLAILVANAQMMGGKPPKELAKVNFMLGTWKGSETMGGMGGPPSTSRSTVTTVKKLNGRYYSGTHIMKTKEGTMEGMHMLTYDPAKKAYVAYWFDSEAAGAMEMTGNFVGKSLVMVSKPMDMPGMGQQTFRATWTPNGARGLSFKLEGKAGDKWATYITGTYKR